MTMGAGQYEFRSTLLTELPRLRILSLTFGAFHFGPPKHSLRSCFSGGGDFLVAEKKSLKCRFRILSFGRKREQDGGRKPPKDVRLFLRLPIGPFWISHSILQLQKVEVVLFFDL